MLERTINPGPMPFYWLSSPGRETLRESLVVDYEALLTHSDRTLLRTVEMRVIATLMRISRSSNPARIDYRRLSRGADLGLCEVRWQFSEFAGLRLLRLFVREELNPNRRIGLRFFIKRVERDLSETNDLQDIAIDNAKRIYLSNINKSDPVLLFGKTIR